MKPRSWPVLMSGNEDVLAIAPNQDECWKVFYSVMRGSLVDPSEIEGYEVFRARWEKLTYFTKVQEIEE